MSTSVAAPSKTKVLLVAAIYTPPYSGAGYLAQLLKSSSFASAFELRHLDTAFVDSIAALEAMTPGKAVRFLKYLLLLVRVLFTYGPDVVILCPAFGIGTFVKDSIYTLVCARLFRRRVIWWCHAWGIGRLYERAHPLFRHYIRWTVTSVERIAIVGSRQVHDFRALHVTHQLTTLHGGVPVERFDPGRFLGRADVRVLYFANLEETKGWRVLLDAARDICSRRLEVRFDFYGNPAKDSSLPAIADAFAAGPFTDRIRYHGPAYGEAKRQAFEQADIFCFPTFFPVETFGLVNLEAMNAGLPIVSTWHASVSDAIADGLGGLLVPSRDVGALTAALMRLVDDPELRLTMGCYNEQRFLNDFTVEKFVERWIALVRSVGAETAERSASAAQRS